MTDSTGASGIRDVRQAAVQFLVIAAPVWIASLLLWSYDGGQNLWNLKNEIELVSVAILATGATFWIVFGRRFSIRPIIGVPIFLASSAFLLGGFKAANDYLDLPDFLLGILAQLVGFICLRVLVRLGSRDAYPPPVLDPPRVGRGMPP